MWFTVARVASPVHKCMLIVLNGDLLFPCRQFWAALMDVACTAHASCKAPSGRACAPAVTQVCMPPWSPHTVCRGWASALGVCQARLVSDHGRYLCRPELRAVDCGCKQLPRREQARERIICAGGGASCGACPGGCSNARCRAGRLATSGHALL